MLNNIYKRINRLSQKYIPKSCESSIYYILNEYSNDYIHYIIIQFIGIGMHLSACTIHLCILHGINSKYSLTFMYSREESLIEPRVTSHENSWLIIVTNYTHIIRIISQYGDSEESEEYILYIYVYIYRYIYLPTLTTDAFIHNIWKSWSNIQTLWVV